jgi:hypothetical protein
MEWFLRGMMLSFVFLVYACSLGTTDSSDGSGTTDEELTLTTCTTSIDSDAPDFFQTYFKCITTTTDSTFVTVSSDGLPPHRSYYYGEDDPNYEDFDYSRGDEYSPNPNQISEQDISIQIPTNPTSKGLTITTALVDGTVGTSDEEYPMGASGIALDGVALFNPLAAPGDDIADEAFTFDSYNSHPTGTGFYHYHTSAPGPLEVMESLGLDAELYGIMCDGTVVLGCTELDGETADDGDFDAQNGHVHDISDEEDTVIFEDRYHTHICPDLFTDHLYTPEIQYYDSCEID